jgi:hypothetical protein
MYRHWTPGNSVAIRHYSMTMQASFRQLRISSFKYSSRSFAAKSRLPGKQQAGPCPEKSTLRSDEAAPQFTPHGTSSSAQPKFFSKLIFSQNMVQKKPSQVNST